MNDSRFNNKTGVERSIVYPVSLRVASIVGVATQIGFTPGSGWFVDIKGLLDREYSHAPKSRGYQPYPSEIRWRLNPQGSRSLREYPLMA